MLVDSIKLKIRTTHKRAFTLMEIMITVGVSSLVIGATLYGFVVSARNLEWSACSLQAQANVIERMEQTYSVAYKPQPPNPDDELLAANFPSATSRNLQGTNYTYISDNINQGVTNQFMKMVRVDCIWLFRDTLYTNSVSMLRAPDP
jgi:prepilin-type N-terminal cleavage/methylation domain-containing protein